MKDLTSAAKTSPSTNFLKITKVKFEKKLVKNFTGKLSKRAHAENSMVDSRPVINKMTLYYENDKHIATWQTGTGWFI